MSKRKMEASSVVGEELSMYLVGIEYDDFNDGGFSITAVCDSMENAKQMVEKTHQTFPGVEYDNIVIREYKKNKFYGWWGE